MGSSAPKSSIVSDTGSFAMVPEWLLDSGISPRALMAYCILGRYVDREGLCFPSRETIAERMGCGLRTVDAAMKELRTLGAIDVRRRGTTSNQYTMLRSRFAVFGESESQYSAHEREPLNEKGRSASSEDLPNPLPQPPQAASFRETVAAFYEAPENRKVGALIDMARSLGIERSGQAAKLITDFGAGRDIVQALQAAAAEARGDPWPYMRKVLKNGSRQTRREPARSRQAVATKRQLAWGQLYADAKTDELAPPDGWEPGDPVPVGSAREPA